MAYDKLQITVIYFQSWLEKPSEFDICGIYNFIQDTKRLSANLQDSRMSLFQIVWAQEIVFRYD